MNSIRDIAVQKRENGFDVLFIVTEYKGDDIIAMEPKTGYGMIDTIVIDPTSIPIFHEKFKRRRKE